MLEQEIARGAQRKGGDGWFVAEEALVVAVVGNAVRARSVIVHEAEVKPRRPCGSLCGKAQRV